MRKFLAIALVAVALSACNNKAKEEAAQAQALAEATHQELLQAIEERDELIGLVSEIATTTSEIKDLEHIVSINASGSEKGMNTGVQSDLSAIKETLNQRRQRIEQLEATLKKSKTSNDKLLQTVETLKNQINEQMSEIESLTNQLYAANEQIRVLDQKVDTLKSQVAQTSSRLEEANQAASRLDTQLNTVYYAIGTKDELKKHNIIEGGGFLKKQKVMTGEFDKAFFRQADKRALSVLPLHSKKAKIVSANQPKASYEIVDNNGQKELRILNPEEFWGVSNFVVIQID